MAEQSVGPRVAEFLVAWQALERAARRARERSARQGGIRVIDFQVLEFLGSEPGRTPKAVGEEFHLTSGGVTALVDRLEDAGYLIRGAHPTDRRSSLLVLTLHGKGLVSGAAAVFASVTETALSRDLLSDVTAAVTHLARTLENTHG